jgi:copper transport protein
LLVTSCSLSEGQFSPLTFFNRVLAGIVVGFVFLVMAGSSASAHAQLEGTDPSAGEVLAFAPSQVTLTFSERVEVAGKAIQVFDDHLRAVSTGAVAAVDPDGRRLRVAMPAGLARGTYTVSWRVSSGDTHPVSGSFRFSIGAPSTVTGVVPVTSRNDLAGLLLGIMRGAGFLGLVLGPGLLLVACFLWRPGLGDRRTRRLLYAGLSLLVFSTLGEMLLQGVWASGRPFSAIWSSPGTLDTGSVKFDQLHALRFYLLVAFGVAMVVALASTPPRTAPRTGPVGLTRGPLPALLAVVSTSGALMATWAFAGHSAVGDLVPLAVTANLTHLVAMTMWLGGLAMIVVSLGPADRGADLATVLPRFSRLAFGCLSTLVVTGTFMAWREVGSVDALTSTGYGRVLLVKLLGVLALLALGNMARRWVGRHLPSRPRSRVLLGAASVVPATEMTFRPMEYGKPELRRLRGGLLAELVIAFVVLGLTAALVAIVPGRQDLVRPFHRVLSGSGLTVVLDIPNPRVGDAILHVMVTTSDGRPQPITALTGSISKVSPPLGPLPLEPRSPGGASPTGMEDLGMNLSAPGEWTLRLSVQTTPIDSTVFSTQVSVS